MTGAHVIGFAGKDGEGLAGAERALNAPIKGAAGKATVPLSIDLRVQGALQDELEKAAAHFQVKDAVGMVVNVRTGEILAMASYPGFDPNAVGKADPATMVNHAAQTVYEPGSVFKVFTLAMGLDTGMVDVDTKFDVPLADRAAGSDDPRLRQGRPHPAAVGGVHPTPRTSARRGWRSRSARPTWTTTGGPSASSPRPPVELIESAHPLYNRRLSENIVATMGLRPRHLRQPRWPSPPA